MPYSESEGQRNNQLKSLIKKGICTKNKKNKENNIWATPVGYSHPVNTSTSSFYVNPITQGNCCEILVVFNNNYQISQTDVQLNNQNYYIYGYQLLQQKQQNP